MHLMYFTEQPMGAYDAAEGLKYGATALTFSNRHYDSAAASRLYNEYLEEYVLADEWGVDGIMLNEHHNAPFCMQAKCNVFASILAAMTKRVKIVLLGNPLPLADNPVRLAEELAMIDMVSRSPWSRSTMSGPTLTGTTSRSKCPCAQAAWARVWERRPKASVSARDSTPPRLPTGVRTASTITAVPIAHLRHPWSNQN